MDVTSLRADCDRCAGLCCVALAFDRGPKFGFDKAAGEPCRHLLGHGCAIYGERTARGFAGCADYDCYGAGQRATQELSGGRSWRDDPQAAAVLFDAFRALRQAHELLLLLIAAERLPLSPAERSQRAELCAALDPAHGWSCESLRDFERGPLPETVTAFLRSLAPLVRRAPAGCGRR